MAQNQLHQVIKEIAVKSAELLECIQWSASECDRKAAKTATLQLAELAQKLLKELDEEGEEPKHIG